MRSAGTRAACEPSRSLDDASAADRIGFGSRSATRRRASARARSPTASSGAKRSSRRRAAAGALAELAHAYYLLHLAYTSLGSPERARVRDLALPIYEELGDLLGQANALNNLGIDAYYEGRWDDALDYYERSRRARERIGDVVGAATIANNIAEILSDQGRIERGRGRCCTRCDETCDAAGSRLMSAVATANLGRAAARAGRADEARRAPRRGARRAPRDPGRELRLETEVRLAEAAVLAGDHERALAEAHAAPSASDVAARRLSRRCSTACARTRTSRPASTRRRRRRLERSLEHRARGGDALYEVALTLRARGALAGDASDAAEARALLDSLHVVRVPEPPL